VISLARQSLALPNQVFARGRNRVASITFGTHFTEFISFSAYFLSFVILPF